MQFKNFTSGASKLADVFQRSCVGNVASAIYASSGTGATMLQVVKQAGSTGDVFELGRLTVAAILNALTLGVAFPVSAEQVIKMFNATHGTGFFDALNNGGTVKWYRADVILYLKKLQS